MGYNEYECIVCGEIIDNGWGNCEYQFYQRVSIIEERIGKDRCRFYPEI